MIAPLKLFFVVTCLLILACMQVVRIGGVESTTSVSRRIAQILSSEEGYRTIFTKIGDWLPVSLAPHPGSLSKNSCAAFVSTVLREGGVPVPNDLPQDSIYEDRFTIRSPSLLVDRLVTYLVEHNWKKSLDWIELTAGDLVVTKERESLRLDHITIFSSFIDKAHGIARVTDNQGFQYERPLHPAADSPYSNFAFFLRAPDEP